MMVVLGELGGRDEYSLVEALKQGKVQKPVVAWVSGTCARLFKSEVQFGHAVSFERILALLPSVCQVSSTLTVLGPLLGGCNRVQRVVVS
jgi:succinyl-CoA synthetase alpha subunit